MNGIYISIVGVALVGIAALLAAWLAWSLSAKSTLRVAYRAGIAFIFFIATVAVMTWDVALTSIKMAELCPQAGIFVKRSIRAEGFYTNFGSPDMLDRGFKYVESRSYGDRLVVYGKEEGGEVRKEEFDARTYRVKSRYEFIYDVDSGAFQGRNDIGIQRSVVRDRETKEELGYALRYKAFPGWVDRNTIARLGNVMWMCQSHMDQEIQLRKQALLPN